MINHVLKISQKGFDVKEARDNQLLFNSDYPTLKVHKQGAGFVTCTIAQPKQTVVIKHDLNIIPMYFASSERIDSDYTVLSFGQLPYIIPILSVIYATIRPIPSKTNLTLEFDLADGLIPGDVRLRYYYYIFEDPIIDVKTYG